MDKSELLAEQYADASNLSARGEFNNRFSVKDRHPHSWVLEQLSLPSDATVLDIGCGPGSFWSVNEAQIQPDWRVFLADFSRDMVEQARNRGDSVDATTVPTVADAERLPFDDGAIDAAFAFQMLYHLPNLDAGLAELRRVLASDGRLYASSGSTENARPLFEMMSSVADDDVDTIAGGFTAENGHERLESHFSRVERRVFENEIRVDDPDAVVAYALSLPLDDPALEAFDPTDAAALRDRAAKRVERDGEIAWTKNYALFVVEP